MTRDARDGIVIGLAAAALTFVTGVWWVGLAALGAFWCGAWYGVNIMSKEG